MLVTEQCDDLVIINLPNGPTTAEVDGKYQPLIDESVVTMAGCE